MKQRKKRNIIISTVVACSLIFGATSTGAESKISSTNKPVQTTTTKKVKKTKKVVPTKGVITLPKKFKSKTVANELKPEAAKLIKTYGSSLGNGKTNTFNSYVKKHVAPKIDTNYLLGHSYSIENYSDKVKGTRKVNSKEATKKYSAAVKKVTTSKVKIDDKRVKNGFATFSFEFQPKNYSPMNVVIVYFKFYQLKDGKYVLESIHYY